MCFAMFVKKSLILINMEKIIKIQVFFKGLMIPREACVTYEMFILSQVMTIYQIPK